VVEQNGENGIVIKISMKKNYILFIVLSLNIAACKNHNGSKIENDNDWALLVFVKADSINPILKPSADRSFICPVKKEKVNWEEKNVLNPSAVVKDNKVYLIYRAQDSAMTSRLGLAISNDGLHFEKQAAPIFFPDNDSMQQYEWSGGVEDPRVIETEDGSYILTYTSYDGKTARLCIASSKDLRTWIKHGLVLSSEKYKDAWSKSGAIICKQNGNKITATKINGKYWMYFGDTELFMATSDDLIHWEVAENAENKKMISVLHPRMGYFDSRLVEPGPYALLREEGVLLIYNASNAQNFNDTSLPKFTYAAGQALFDKNNPYKLIKRTDNFFIHPNKEYEKIGEVNEVCFVEGLVYFNNKWFLYYGTADSKIAVAVRE
jgi:beta-1,2-mannosidase